MKRLILLLSIITLFCQSVAAQTGGLNFQGVARNATGVVLANQKINLKFTILKTTETGTVEYTETKEVTTNAQGIFAAVVGEVNATSFAAVDWKVTPKFLKVEMDPTGGTSFVAMGTTRLQNVPYAYYANGVNANNIDGTVPVTKGGTGAINAAGARSNIGAESISNKSTDLLADATSITKYPSVKTIKDYVDTKVASGNISGTTIAIANGGTGATTASAALTNLGAESTANKSTDITADAASLTKYPSVKSIKDYVDAKVLTGVFSSTYSAKVIVGSVTETTSSAVLEVNSTTKGFLPPRMTNSQRNAITNPEVGLMIYCIDCGTYGEWQGYNGNRWTNISGAPASSSSINNFIFNDVISRRTGRIWMDRNLGASRVATSSSDPESYGDYYQWGRLADGHQIKTSNVSTSKSNTDQPGNNFFIIGPYDWRNPPNDNLWQGVNGTNNPCPTGYRLATITEWNAEVLGSSIDAFASPLKLPLPGYRLSSSGSFI